MRDELFVKKNRLQKIRARRLTWVGYIESQTVPIVKITSNSVLSTSITEAVSHSGNLSLCNVAMWKLHIEKSTTDLSNHKVHPTRAHNHKNQNQYQGTEWDATKRLGDIILDPDFLCLLCTFHEFDSSVSMKCKPEHHVIKLRNELHGSKVFEQLDCGVRLDDDNKGSKKYEYTLKELAAQWHSNSQSPDRYMAVFFNFSDLGPGDSTLGPKHDECNYSNH